MDNYNSHFLLFGTWLLDFLAINLHITLIPEE